MKAKIIIPMLLTIIALPMDAQIFNFSLRTNNQQLIDEALSGAFVKINQSYELCDTITNKHFGRDEKDYFNIVPFIGVETEQGLIFPTSCLSPWTYDKDFEKYKSKYKPQATQTKLNVLNGKDGMLTRNIKSPITGSAISEDLCVFNDSTHKNCGLKIDTISGKKNGWLIWLSSTSNLSNTDSVRFTSIKKTIQVPLEGELLPLDKPEISENVYGGVYVTPVQSCIGQITLALTGVIVANEDGWHLDCPFIKMNEENETLTPINEATINTKRNTPKKKKR